MFSKRAIILIVVCLLVFIQSLYYFLVATKYDAHEIFLEATYALQGNFSIINETLPNCSSLSHLNSNNRSSDYKVSVQETLFTAKELEAKHYTVQLGGHWSPIGCQPQQHLAIIVCHRNREKHLRIFLNNIHPFLQEQNLYYTIFVVNQFEPNQFNRATLFNVGFIEALKLHPFDCFIFHDVDLLPEDRRNIYQCGDQPRHMAVAIEKFSYKLPYWKYFGGATAYSRRDFLDSNGCPNVYWGWGGEDDDMYWRVTKHLNKSVVRYPVEIARYKAIRSYHRSASPNPNRFKILQADYDYRRDGINTTQYKLHQVSFYKLFTLINVTLIQESYEQIKTRLKIKEK